MNTLPRTEQRLRKWPRRLLVWSAIIFGVLASLMLLIMLLAPGIINTDSVREAIERTVSKELGGTVTIDSLKLVLLPRPEIDIRKLTIDVPGAASASVASASIYAKFLPLFLGRFEISSVSLERPVLALTLQSDTERTGKRKKQPPARSPVSVLAAADRTMPDLSLKISKGSLAVAREGEAVLSLNDLTAELAFVPDEQAPEDHFHIAGSAEAVLTGISALPGPMNISIGRFDARQKDLAVSRSRARLLDMDMRVSGSLRDYLSGASGLEIVLNGQAGKEGLNWIRALTGLPETTVFRAPLEAKDVRLRMSGKGETARMSLSGVIALQDGASVSLALQKKPDLFTVERFEVKDRDSDAVLRLTSGKQELDLSFTGVLTGATVARIIERDQPLFSRVAGDLRMHLPRGRWREASAEGYLEGEGIMIVSRPSSTLSIGEFTAQALGRAVELRSLVVSLGTNTLAAEGTAALSDAGVALDLDVSADRINVASLQELLKGKKTDSEKKAPAEDRQPSVKADLRIRAAAVTFPSYTAENVAMTLSTANGRTEAVLEHATFCGIGLTGTLKADRDGVEVRLEPRARGGALNETIRCIMPAGPKVTGTYDLSGLFTSRGPWDRLLPSAQGNLDLSARKGRIQNDRIVKGIIAYLNSTSLLKDSHTSLLKEGVPYETITFRGAVRDGVIRLQQGLIKSKDINITAEGDIDLRNETLDLTVLAAPFTSMDRLLGSIPIVREIAGRSLIVVPVKVEGPIKALKVKPLAASGVSMNITNLMKNIVQMPVKIVEPILPSEREKGPEDGTQQGQP